MLDKLPKRVWSDPTLTWYDPANGLGNFMIVVYLRLMKGLASKIPDEKKRKRHIIENMLYMSEINKKNVYICKRIFDSGNQYAMNIHVGDSLTFDHTKKAGWPKKFNIIIGNPPYNKSFTGKNGYAAPLYHLFIQKYIDQCDRMLFIVPCRWFTGGKGLDKFRAEMLARRDIVYLDTIPDSEHPFGTDVQIKGGVCHFLKDASYTGSCNYNGLPTKLNHFDILVDSKYIPIISRTSSYDSITRMYCSKGHYGIPLTDKRLHATEGSNDLKCYVSKIRGFVNYIKEKQAPHDKLGGYKVITVTASSDGGCFGNMFVAGKNEMHSESYISFATDTHKQALSLLSYLRCRLPNLLLIARKQTHNISKTTCEWIPDVPLDREWTDALVYKHLGLTKAEIKLAESIKIPGYTPLITGGKIIKETDNSKPLKKVISGKSLKRSSTSKAGAKGSLQPKRK
jgi:site-specific DNA-methyltransferase (adenine-specific)